MTSNNNTNKNKTKDLKDAASSNSVAAQKKTTKKKSASKQQLSHKAAKVQSEVQKQTQAKTPKQTPIISDVKAAQNSEPVTSKPSSGKGLSWLALVLALAGLGAGGYAAYQTTLTKQVTSLKTSTFEDRISLLGSDQNSVKGQVEQIKTETYQQVQTLNKKLEAVNTKVADHSGVIEGLQATASEAVAQITGDLGQRVARWRLDELRSLLSQVEQYYRFTGDGLRAKEGLQLAQSGLVNIDNPQLSVVKTAISKDLLNLDARQSIDVSLLHDELSSISNLASKLTFASGFNSPSTLETKDEQGSSEKTASNPVLAIGQTLLSDIGRLVKHKKANAPLKPSLDESAKFVIQESLQLNIQAAMLALIRRDNTPFQLQIKRAMSTVNTYFNTTQSQAKTVLSALTKVSDKDISLQIEPIASALTVLDKIILAEDK